MKNIIVTGNNGFIGSNLVQYLNEQKIYNVIGVDSDNDRYVSVSEFYTIEEFTLKLLTAAEFSFIKNSFFDNIDAVFHLGALVDTSSDNDKIFDYNFSFSKLLFECCHNYKIPLFYASSAAVYGNSKIFKEDISDLHPLNLYGKSKYLFDEYVSIHDYYADDGLCYGFRFFNVYGPNELHKGKMSSAITQIYAKARINNLITLFKSIDPEIPDGLQKRDFIHVNDVVQILYKFYLKRNNILSGVYNIGTGKATSFLDIANCAIKSFNNKVVIKFIETPKDIKKSYQSFTEADMNKTFNVIEHKFDENNILKYYEWLNDTYDDKSIKLFYDTIKW
jgi:ADP-L-glycero-D-manno-heptose 6-epimerase